MGEEFEGEVRERVDVLIDNKPNGELVKGSVIKFVQSFTLPNRENKRHIQTMYAPDEWFEDERVDIEIIEEPPAVLQPRKDYLLKFKTKSGYPETYDVLFSKNGRADSDFTVEVEKDIKDLGEQIDVIFTTPIDVDSTNAHIKIVGRNAKGETILPVREIGPFTIRTPLKINIETDFTNKILVKGKPFSLKFTAKGPRKRFHIKVGINGVGGKKETIEIISGREAENDRIELTNLKIPDTREFRDSNDCYLWVTGIDKDGFNDMSDISQKFTIKTNKRIILTKPQNGTIGHNDPEIKWTIENLPDNQVERAELSYILPGQQAVLIDTINSKKEGSYSWINMPRFPRDKQCTLIISIPSLNLSESFPLNILQHVLRVNVELPHEDEVIDRDEFMASWKVEGLQRGEEVMCYLDLRVGNLQTSLIKNGKKCIYGKSTTLLIDISSWELKTDTKSQLKFSLGIGGQRVEQKPINIMILANKDRRKEDEANRSLKEKVALARRNLHEIWAPGLSEGVFGGLLGRKKMSVSSFASFVLTPNQKDKHLDYNVQIIEGGEYIVNKKPIKIISLRATMGNIHTLVNELDIRGYPTKEPKIWHNFNTQLREADSYFKNFIMKYNKREFQAIIGKIDSELPDIKTKFNTRDFKFNVHHDSAESLFRDKHALELLFGAISETTLGSEFPGLQNAYTLFKQMMNDLISVNVRLKKLKSTLSQINRTL
jgi:hypothetical protein